MTQKKRRCGEGLPHCSANVCCFTCTAWRVQWWGSLDEFPQPATSPGQNFILLTLAFLRSMRGAEANRPTEGHLAGDLNGLDSKPHRQRTQPEGTRSISLRRYFFRNLHFLSQFGFEHRIFESIDCFVLFAPKPSVLRALPRLRDHAEDRRIDGHRHTDESRDRA